MKEVLKGELGCTAHLDAIFNEYVSISGVFTPTSSRGQGYATALMSHLCTSILHELKLGCTLMVDQTAIAALKVYEKVGFQLIDENIYAPIQNKTSI